MHECFTIRKEMNRWSTAEIFSYRVCGSLLLTLSVWFSPDETAGGHTVVLSLSSASEVVCSQCIDYMNEKKEEGRINCRYPCTGSATVWD